MSYSRQPWRYWSLDEIVRDGLNTIVPCNAESPDSAPAGAFLCNSSEAICLEKWRVTATSLTPAFNLIVWPRDPTMESPPLITSYLPCWLSSNASLWRDGPVCFTGWVEFNQRVGIVPFKYMKYETREIWLILIFTLLCQYSHISFCQPQFYHKDVFFLFICVNISCSHWQQTVFVLTFGSSQLQDK